MAITKEELRELASYAAKGKAPANYEFDDVKKAFAAEMRELAGSINRFNQHKYDIFEILIEQADEILPAKIINAIGMFAEVKTIAQGNKAMFKTPVLGRARARKFLTQVGLSGVYETFRLDRTTYEVAVQAIGGGVSIDFERVLDGNDILSDLMEIIVTGLTEAVYQRVQDALRAAALTGATTIAGNTAPAANRVISAGFDSQAMFKLASTVKAYGGSGTGAGGGAVIFAPPEFIAEMGPDMIVPITAGGGQGIFHPDDIDAIHRVGYINLFRGIPIVQIPQSYTDETNTTVWIDPQLAYVLPTGGERVVKVVFEGETQMYDNTNRDQSIEIMVYKKMGVAIEAFHNWGIFQNTDIDNSHLYRAYVNI